MKRATLLIFTLFISGIVAAQDITGAWHGALDIQGSQLRLVVNIVATDAGYSATLDSPDQGAFGIPIDSTSFKDESLYFEAKNLGLNYNGRLANNAFTGTFSQGGMILPLTLSREAIAKKEVNRPQEPKAPFGYYTEDVTFKNEAAKVTLAGTLTLPKKEGKYPVVVLISGSGPQNRDEELLGHKPFLVLADHLTKKGIGVLRYDDRGTAKSTGDFSLATSADFATDVASAVAYLKTRKEVNAKQIGLAGHSEGGLIAPMVAATNPDVNYIVLLAGTGIQGDKLLKMQGALLEKAAGFSEGYIEASDALRTKVFDLVFKSNNTETLREEIKMVLEKTLETNPDLVLQGMTKEQFITAQITQVSSPWMQYFLKYDPVVSLEKVRCPVLAINGDKDLQVPAKENIEAIAAALDRAGNKNVKTIIFPSLNHLFQECETGTIDEYNKIEQTFAPVALEAISDWILLQTK